MHHAKGNILQFTPDNTGWTARFTGPDADESSWTLDVIGWAVAVSWISTDDTEEFGTEVLPVVLLDEDTALLTTEEYLSGLSDGCKLASLTR